MSYFYFKKFLLLCMLFIFTVSSTLMTMEMCQDVTMYAKDNLGSIHFISNDKEKTVDLTVTMTTNFMVFNILSVGLLLFLALVGGAFTLVELFHLEDDEDVDKTAVPQETQYQKLIEKI